MSVKDANNTFYMHGQAARPSVLAVPNYRSRNTSRTTETDHAIKDIYNSQVEGEPVNYNSYSLTYTGESLAFTYYYSSYQGFVGDESDRGC